MKLRPIILTAAAAVVFAACGSGGASKAPTSTAPSMAPSDGMMSHSPSMSAGPSASATTGVIMTDTAAADLRTNLNLALGVGAGLLVVLGLLISTRLLAPAAI